MNHIVSDSSLAVGQLVGLGQLEHKLPTNHQFESHNAEIYSPPDVAPAWPRICYLEVAGESLRRLS